MMPQAVIDRIASMVYALDNPGLYKRKSDWIKNLDGTKEALEKLAQIYGNEIYPIFFECLLYYLTNKANDASQYGGKERMHWMYGYCDAIQEIYTFLETLPHIHHYENRNTDDDED